MKTREWLASDEGKLHMKGIRKYRSDERKALLASMSDIEREQYLRHEADDKSHMKFMKEERKEARVLKLEIKRELSILKYMLKTGVICRHHNQEVSERKEIEAAIVRVKEGRHKYYEEYSSHYKVDSMLGESHLGHIWNHSEFNTIYDVPLDGSYIFHSYDSGIRGSGSRFYLTATKVSEKFEVPHVDPGGFIQVEAKRY